MFLFLALWCGLLELLMLLVDVVDRDSGMCVPVVGRMQTILVPPEAGPKMGSIRLPIPAAPKGGRMRRRKRVSGTTNKLLAGLILGLASAFARRGIVKRALAQSDARRKLLYAQVL
jgi:hypothetical protein